MTDGTGSGRRGAGSLPTLSLGASTLAVSDLASPAGLLASPAGLLASPAGLARPVLPSTAWQRQACHLRSWRRRSERRFWQRRSWQHQFWTCRCCLQSWRHRWTARPSQLRPGQPPRFSAALRRRAWRACRAFAWRLVCCRSRPAPGSGHPRVYWRRALRLGLASRLASRPGRASLASPCRLRPLGFGPGSFRRRRGRLLPAAEAVELIRPSVLLGVLLLRLILRLVARVGSAVGDEERGKQRGHLAARRIVLAQKARQRRSRDVLQQAPRALVAGAAGAREYLGRALAGFEIFHRPRPTAVRQPIRSVTVAIMSARLNIPCFSRYGIASNDAQLRRRRSPFSRLCREWKRTHCASA